MVDWFMYTQIFIALAAGLLCLVVGFLGREPNDLTMGATLLVGLLIIAQLVTSIVAPFVGNPSRGSELEFWMYQIAVLLLPFLGIAWGLIARTRWSNIVLGVAGLAVAVMLYRMGVIWFDRS